MALAVKVDEDLPRSALQLLREHGYDAVSVILQAASLWLRREASALERRKPEAALIVAQSAQHNRQSRGCHYRVDSVEGGDRLI